MVDRIRCNPVSYLLFNWIYLFFELVFNFDLLKLLTEMPIYWWQKRHWHFKSSKTVQSTAKEFTQITPKENALQESKGLFSKLKKSAKKLGFS